MKHSGSTYYRIWLCLPDGHHRLSPRDRNATEILFYVFTNLLCENIHASVSSMLWSKNASYQLRSLNPSFIHGSAISVPRVESLSKPDSVNTTIYRRRSTSKKCITGNGTTNFSATVGALPMSSQPSHPAIMQYGPVQMAIHPPRREWTAKNRGNNRISFRLTRQVPSLDLFPILISGRYYTVRDIRMFRARIDLGCLG